MVAYASLIVVLVAGVLTWRWMLRTIHTPVSSVETPGASVTPEGPPSNEECASFARGMASQAAAQQRMSPEGRDRLRQCLERR
jgi:hypothetical protein